MRAKSEYAGSIYLKIVYVNFKYYVNMFLRRKHLHNARNLQEKIMYTS